MLNVVAIMGRLVADPELRTTQSGINVVSFRIACDRNFARQGEQRQADFIDIVAWRQQAEFVSKYFQKGSLIAIEGSLQTRQYQDKNGNNRTAGRCQQHQLCRPQEQQSRRRQLSERCSVLSEPGPCPSGCCGGCSQLLVRQCR